MNQTQRHLEGQILETIRQLELGREEASEELNSTRASLREAADECRRRIEDLTDDANEDLVRLQQRLGELHDLLADGANEGLDSLQSLATLHTGIEEAATLVLADLDAMTGQGGPWNLPGSRMRRAWQQFSARMTLVEAHLNRAVASASEEFFEERSRLAADLRKLRGEAPDHHALQKGLDELAGAYQWFKGALRILLLHPDHDQASALPEHEAMLVKLSTNKTVRETATALQAAVTSHHFGVMQVHDLQETMNNKGVEFARECLIFEVCQPEQAKKVLDENMGVSTALPCRISIYGEGGKTILATLKPTTLLAMFDTPQLKGVAREVEDTIVNIMKAAAA